MWFCHVPVLILVRVFCAFVFCLLFCLPLNKKKCSTSGSPSPSHLSSHALGQYPHCFVISYAKMNGPTFLLAATSAEDKKQWMTDIASQLMSQRRTARNSVCGFVCLFGCLFVSITVVVVVVVLLICTVSPLHCHAHTQIRRMSLVPQNDALMPVAMRGYLTKRGEQIKSWKRRYFEVCT